MSLRMSSRARYGLRLMVSLAMNHPRVTGEHAGSHAGRDQAVGVSLLREIALREGISEKYLGQIIIPLKASGLVASQRGAHGGYSLARAPEDITVRDVVEAIEGAIAPVPCQDPAAGAGEAECADAGDGSERATSHVTMRVWQKLHQDITASLSAFTLLSLAREAREVGEPVENYVI